MDAGAGDGEDSVMPGLCYSTRCDTSFRLLEKKELRKVVENTSNTSDERLEMMMTMILQESPEIGVL